VAIELDPFDSRVVADHAHGVRENRLVGDDGGKRTLGQRAVADLAAARPRRKPTSPTLNGGKL